MWNTFGCLKPSGEVGKAEEDGGGGGALERVDEEEEEVVPEAVAEEEGVSSTFFVLEDVEESSNSSLTCTLLAAAGASSPAAAAAAAAETPPPFPVVVRSLGLFWEVGVSQELESELTELLEAACCVLNLRLLASSPSCGDFSPMSESMGKSFGGFLGPAAAPDAPSGPPGLVTDRFSGEKEVSGSVSPGCGGRAEEEEESGGHRSDVLGVVSTGVTSMSSAAASPFVICAAAAVAAAAAAAAVLPSGDLPAWCAAAGAGGAAPHLGGMAGKPRGDMSIMLEMDPADSGMNLGVVSISSDDDDDDRFPCCPPPADTLGGDPPEDAPEAVPVLFPPPPPPPPRSSPVILAEAVLSIDSIKG